jgi:hypothetical protein
MYPRPGDRAEGDDMGTQKSIERKPRTTVHTTEVIRIRLKPKPAPKNFFWEGWMPRLLAAGDPDREPGRGRDPG